MLDFFGVREQIDHPKGQHDVQEEEKVEIGERQKNKIGDDGKKGHFQADGKNSIDLPILFF